MTTDAHSDPSAVSAGIALAPPGSRIALIDFAPDSLTAALLIVSPDGSVQVSDSRGLPPVSATDLTESGLPAVVSAVVDVLRSAGITSPNDLHTLYLSGDAARNPLVQQALRPLCADQRVRAPLQQQVSVPPVPRSNSGARLGMIIAAVVAVVLVVVVGVVTLGRGGSAKVDGLDYPSVVVGPEGTKQAVLDPAANRLYVANDMAKTVAVVDVTTRTVVAKIAFPDVLAGIAIDPVLHMLYGVGKGDREAKPAVRGSLSIVDTITNSVVTSIATGEESAGVAVDPVSHRVYVTNNLFQGYQQDPKVVNFNAAATVSVIDPQSATVVDSVEVGSDAGQIAIDPTGRTAYILGGYYPERNTEYGLLVFDLASHRVTRRLVVPSNGPQSMAVDFATNTAVVTDINQLYVLDLASNSVVQTIRGSDFGAITVDPEKHRAYIVETGGSGYRLRVFDTSTRVLAPTVETGMKMLVGSAVDPRSHVVYALIGDTVTFIPAPA
ncbi:YncE family protein [Nocardia sp. NPDC004722]